MVEKGTTLTLPPADLGWGGMGSIMWWKNAAYTEYHPGNSVTPVEDTVLYGRYEGDPLVKNEAYAVVLVPVKASHGSRYSAMWDKGTDFPLPEPAAVNWTPSAGNDFLGWYMEPECVTRYTLPTIPVANNIVLYGLFRGDIQHTVTLVRPVTKDLTIRQVNHDEWWTVPTALEMGWRLPQVGDHSLTWYQYQMYGDPVPVTLTNGQLKITDDTVLFGEMENDHLGMGEPPTLYEIIIVGWKGNIRMMTTYSPSTFSRLRDLLPDVDRLNYWGYTVGPYITWYLASGYEGRVDLDSTPGSAMTFSVSDNAYRIYLREGRF